MKKRILLFATAIVAILIAAVLAEAILWIIDAPTPRAFIGPRLPLTEDPVLGWKNRPGRFLVSLQPGDQMDNQNQTIYYTNRTDGRRATAPLDILNNTTADKVILIGGSFVYGENVTDAATFAWKLQKTRPDLAVLNYGVRAYGTYQSLLMLEKVLPATQSPRLVIYGIIPHHRYRNTTSRFWQASLSYHATTPVAMPYVTLGGNGKLIRHQPKRAALWPLSKKLKTVFLAEMAWYVCTRDDEQHLDIITQKLIWQMNRLCKSYDCQFMVVILSSLSEDLKSTYEQFFISNRIPCVYFSSPSENMIIGGHPNAEAHAAYAQVLTSALSSILKKPI